MSALADSIKLFFDDYARAIIEVTWKHGGRVGYHTVATDMWAAAHCPELDESDSPSALKIFMENSSDSMDQFDLSFDESTREFICTPPRVS